MYTDINVNYENKPCYQIYLRNDFYDIKEIMQQLQLSNRKVCVVTDSTVGELYLKEVLIEIQPYCSFATSYTFPAGEKSKTLDTVQKVYEHLIIQKFDRNDVLFALGGGVVGDLTGYVAATYLRGIRFVQVPTSLLSMVDSSIGGKTGVDFSAYKNMVGAFHQPKAVYMNLSTLLSLTDKQYLSGLGEIVKHGLIRDKDYYEFLISHMDQIKKKDLLTNNEMIARSLNIKRVIVEEDPKEKGDRALLNFGHTLGHAIEKKMNFTLLHGECVGLGCIASCYLSYLRGYLSLDEVEKIRSVFEEFNFPVSVSGLDVNEINEITKSDKKMDSGQIKFVLLKTIGQAYIDLEVTDEEMSKAMEYILK